MKKLLIGLTLLFSFSTLAADINLGRGLWVCSSEGIDNYPTVARGQTRTEAKHFAQQACADYEGSDFHCDVEQCVKDTNRNNINIDINFTVERSGSNVSINLTDGDAGYVCTSEAWRKSYIAKAPTRLEAKVLATQNCVADGNSGMHCDVEECEALSGSRDSRGSSRGEVCVGFGAFRVCN